MQLCFNNSGIQFQNLSFIVQKKLKLIWEINLKNRIFFTKQFYFFADFLSCSKGYL